ncbi:MAG TPA: PBP1A family penicillin-binding protein [Bryobacteraceae bacterium]|nr:PBP1A family penicillin-binding protein [Bryobacteraceae bacterium]
MPARPKTPRKSLFIRFLVSPWGRAFLIAFFVTVASGLGVFTYFYEKYAGITEEKLKAGPFSNTSLLYAAPEPVEVGEEDKISDIADYLRRAGYNESSNNRLGWFNIRPDAIEINPGPEAYDSEGAVIKFSGGHIAQIISLRDQTERNEYQLEPELITNLFDKKREKRKIVHFNEIPQVMVNAVLAAEDKHFFQHSGFDPMGILRATLVDLKERRESQGASTLTNQLARTLFLGQERGWKRKLQEIMITLHLEQDLTKQQIFEYYADSIDVGHEGSFGIRGFAQAADVYLGKDLSQVTIPDAALLAGLVQAPMSRNPFRHPERAKARRNVVLRAMLEDGFITQKQYDDSIAAPLDVTHEEAESSDAPYFVDLVDDSLQNQFEGRDFLSNSYRVYTTLDMNLQRDAVEAVREGIKETDAIWKRRNKKYGTAEFPPAQVALICLDAETGDLKALVGGRAYGVSQLDHAMAKRQPGSSFKPFVYATAFATALDPSGQGPVITPATIIDDEPTTFWYDDKPYEPANFKDEYFGEIPAWFALAHSLNVSAVKVAEMVGYDKVAATARAAGLNVDIKPTPSIALGAYEVTPLEIAQAYTVFANNGELIKSGFIKNIRDQRGDSIYQAQPDKKQALDPRVAYLVENTLEEVLRSGTGAGVRARGFTLPAAGKTGTDRDGWFAGFTSKLICVVWVGFDDNRDLKMEGAHSALPIWTDFMIRAHKHPEYRDVHSFDPPDGIVTAEIDADTGQLATPACPHVRTQAFIAGTQPVEMCKLHGGGRTQISGWEPSAAPAAPAGQPQPTVIPDNRDKAPALAAAPPPKTPRSIPIEPAPPETQPQPKKKKGFFGHLKDLFKQQ